VSLVTAGGEVVLTESDLPVARLVPINTMAASRQAGLHAGSVWTSDDFDAPLPEEFWATGA
jgi:antitoxin (DNA-binding transcriptional repressor) of toxin-antitoxin stability system